MSGPVYDDLLVTLIVEHARFKLALECIEADRGSYVEAVGRMRGIAQLALRPIMAPALPLAPEPQPDPEPDDEPDPEPEPTPKPAPQRRPAAKPKPRPASGEGLDGLGPHSIEALQIIREVGEIRPGDLARRMGRGRKTDGYTAPLIARGLIEAEGTTTSRVLRAVETPAAAKRDWNPTVPRPLPSPGEQAKRNGGSTQGRVLESVRYRSGTNSEIAQRLELPVDEVMQALRVLAREGEIKGRAVDGQMIWSGS